MLFSTLLRLNIRFLLEINLTFVPIFWNPKFPLLINFPVVLAALGVLDRPSNFPSLNCGTKFFLLIFWLFALWGGTWVTWCAELYACFWDYSFVAFILASSWWWSFSGELAFSNISEASIEVEDPGGFILNWWAEAKDPCFLRIILLLGSMGDPYDYSCYYSAETVFPRLFGV